jgi:hypothetical protein
MRVERRDQRGMIGWVVADLTPPQEAIINKQFKPSPREGLAFGFPAQAPLAAVAANNLSQLLERLQRGGAARLPSSPWSSALRATIDALDSCGLDWLLIGSAALAVQGVPVEPGDIDICLLGGKAEALALCEAMSPHLICPLLDLGTLVGARWFARAWPGLAVEWLAEVDPDADGFFARQGRVCDFGRTALNEAEVADWDGRRLRVPALSLQLKMAEQRGLDDRVVLIDAAMAERRTAS